MADLESRYVLVASTGFLASSRGADRLDVKCPRWRVGVAALIGAFVLTVLCSVATLLPYTLAKSNAIEATGLFDLAGPQSRPAHGLAPQDIKKVNIPGYQRSILWPFTTIRLQPRRSPILAQTKSEEDTLKAMQKKETDPFLALKIIQKALSLGYLLPPNPFKSVSAPTSWTMEPKTIIYSPSSKGSLDLEWTCFDDNVFGGSSRSSFNPASGAWSGTVDIAPGFASVRTVLLEPPLDFTDCSGLKLGVRGQGQRLKLIIKDDKQLNGVSWSYSFSTDPLLDTEIGINFSEFVATQDARLVEPAPTLNIASITVIQLIYGKFELFGEPNPTFKVGDFEVVVNEISII